MEEAFRKFRQFLNQPYPECKGVWNYFVSSLLIGLFIGMFLYIFEPFGISAAGSSKAWYCTMFGLITFGISFGADLFMRYALRLHRDDESWVFWKWMLSAMIILVLIATANYLFMWWRLQFDLSLTGFLSMFIATVLIGVFPVFFSGLKNSQRAQKINQQLATEIQHDLINRKPVDLSTAAARINFEIDPSLVLFVEALQNYVVVHYLEGDQCKQQIIRSTLSLVESKLKETPIDRTHRSYLVNRNKVVGVSGNAQGLKLQVEGVGEKRIPVSRKYIPHFKQH